MSPADDEAHRLDRHDAEYQSLVAAARGQLARGRLEAAAASAQMAAAYAWMNHTGRFADPALESLLGELAQRLPAAPERPASPAADPREVLHVVTQCYGTGGSTQTIACWMEQDAGRRHRVCITRQGGTPTPEKIAAPLTAPGALVRLDRERGGLVQRALRLRALGTTADVVVLHLHPYDVVPAIAFGGGCAPPVVYVDHCDHVFWAGASGASVVMHMRDSGRHLAAARRGLDPARSTVVPRPLRPLGRTVERAEAKRRLGIEPDRVLLVTAADGSKYRPVGAPGFLDVAVPVIERHPEAMLLAAGPAPEGDWRAAGARTGGRIRALGPLDGVRLLQQAADVYLDSFPFSSLTSLLEAGSLGVAVATYRGHPAECAVLGADTRGVDEHMAVADDPAAFGAVLDGLLADPARRAALGEATSRAIRDTHSGDGWRAAVDALYAQAAEQAGGPPIALAERDRETGRLDILVDLVMRQTGYSDGLPGAVRAHLALLPLRERLATWARLAASGTRPPRRALLPEWALSHLAAARRRAGGLAPLGRLTPSR